ncbi:MAG: hypothetical protein KDD36_10915 [Flavobacteriales bacterium]|nr:hypothetical protein [Flavobacteriales bacterium]
MKNQLGAAYEDFVTALNSPAGPSIRLNTAKVPAKVNLPEVPWCEHACFLQERPVFALDPWWHGGAYFVQESSSMFLCHVVKSLGLTSPILALDLCASPGGKSTLLKDVLPDESLIVANEAIRGRVGPLVENVIRWGSGHHVVTNNDPEAFRRLEGVFDIVLVDAPCSGEGLFRKQEDARDIWSVENLALCEARQKRILEPAMASVRPGGYLIYSTCTYNPGENEDQVKELAASGWDEVRLDPDPAWGFQRAEHGWYAYPHRVKGEGFYISIWQKTDGIGASASEGNAGAITNAPWLSGLDDKKWMVTGRGNAQFVYPQRWAEVMAGLENTLNVRYAGVEAGEMKGKKAVPAHALALMADRSPDSWLVLELAAEEALAYLRRDHVSANTDELGYACIAFDALPLGWVNRLGSRLNNMYPMAWRLRMNGAPVRVLHPEKE